MVFGDIAGLTSSEQSALDEYVTLLVDRLDDALEAVWLYGSAARGDMWLRDSPMHSDIDIVVVTSQPVPESTVDDLVNLTYPLYLRCGRQISPAFKSVDEWQAVATDPDGYRDDVIQDVLKEGRRLWP
jgi:predicted nucleotidyltransferase